MLMDTGGNCGSQKRNASSGGSRWMKSISGSIQGGFIRFRISLIVGVILAERQQGEDFTDDGGILTGGDRQHFPVGTVVISKIILYAAAAGKKVNLDPAIIGRSDYYHAGGYMFDSDLLYCGDETVCIIRSAGGEAGLITRI